MVVLPPVNIFVVALAAISQLLLGMAWYSSVLFGKPWLTSMEVSQKQQKKAQPRTGRQYATLFFGFFLQASVLAVLLERLAITTFADAWVLALLLWIGFNAVTQLSTTSFMKQKMPFHLFMINAGYQLFGLMLMASIIHAL